MLLLGAVVCASATSYGAVRRAAPAPISDGKPFALLERKAQDIEAKNSLNGWGYIASGAVSLGISLPMYYLSKDIFARTIYSLGQTLGVVAIGYGSYLAFVDDEYTRYRRILRGSPSLSSAQRDELARSFLLENASRARTVRKIRVITHGLTAGLNFTSALTSSQSELRTALFFIGGINALAAVSFTFSKSEEEKLYGEIASTRAAAEGGGIQFAAGPGGVGMTIAF